jgi:hypothetical protein
VREGIALDRFDARAAVSPVRVRIGLVRIARWTVRGVGVGALAGIVFLGLLHLGVHMSIGVPVALPVLGALVGAVFGGSRWPNLLQAARAADLHFKLADRLTTALELRGSTEPLCVTQRADAARRVQGLHLRESAGKPFDHREAGVAALAVVLFVGFLFVPVSPAHAARIAPPAPSSQALRRNAIRRLPAIEKRLNHGLTRQEKQTPAMRKLNLALRSLQQKLVRARKEATALRSVSATQQQLHRLAQSLHPVSQSTAKALAEALRKQMTAAERQALTKSHGDKTPALDASVLKRLAQTISHLNKAQRSSMARSLAKAANAASNNSLRSSLRQAASSLGYNDPAAAKSSLQNAASSLDQSPAQTKAQQQLESAQSSLESLKNSLTGLDNTPSANGKGQSGRSQSGRQGAGQNPGQGNGQSGKAGKGQGTGTGKGSGNSKSGGSGKGSGQGKGSGLGQGRGQGLGQGQGFGHNALTGRGTGSTGQGGTGGHGGGGGKGSAGPQGAGKFSSSHIYIPQKPGRGPHTILNGPNGQPLSGASVPYTEVLGQYAASAHSALDRQGLPPNLQHDVLKYFSTISK